MQVLNLQELIKEVREDGDFFNETYITDGQIARKLNKHYKTVYKKYCDSDLGYFIKNFDNVSLLERKSILFPDNFYKLSSLDKRSTNGWIPITKINFSGREAYQYTDETTEDYFLNHLKYYYEGDAIKILPVESTSGVYRLRYYPLAPLIESSTARMFQEHTDYITYKTIAELKMKKELNWQEFSIKAEEIMVGLETQLKERSLDAPETVADVYSEAQSSSLYFDSQVNSYVPATEDLQPQLEEQTEDIVDLEPLDFCFEFEPIDFVLEKPTSGVKGVVNRGFDNFDSLSVNLRDNLGEVIFNDALDSQTFDITLDGSLSFNDFKDYRVDVDGTIEDLASDRLETVVKSFYVEHLLKSYKDVDFRISPVIGGELKDGITNAYGLSLVSNIGDATKIISDANFGSYDESSFIYSGITGEQREIQWIGVYEKDNKKFFSIIFTRETSADTTSASEFELYLDNGEKIDFNLTANNVVSGGATTVVVEKPIQLSDENHNKLINSSTWEIFFEPKSNWYLGQNYGRRKFVEGEIATENKRIAVATGKHTVIDKRPLDSMESDLLSGERLSTNLNVSSRRLHQVAFSYTKESTNNRLVFALKDIQGGDVSQFSCVDRVSFFNIKSDNNMEVQSFKRNIEVQNLDNKVLVRQNDFELPVNFNVSVPRLYTPYAVKEEGNIQVEFRDASDVVTTRQLAYGYESIVQEHVLSNNAGITKVRFNITNPSAGADDTGFINTKVYLNFWDTDGVLQYVEMDSENADKNLTKFDNSRPITIGIA